MALLAFDTETTGLNRHGVTPARMFTYSTCTESGAISVNRLDGSAVRSTQNRNRLEQIIDNPETILTCHKLIFDAGHTEAFLGRKLSKLIRGSHCTLLMSRVLQNNHPTHGLGDLCWELAGIPKADDNAIKPYTKGGQSYQNVPEALMTRYQARDAERGMLLYLFFWQKIQASKQTLDCYLAERDVIVPTLAMEDRGVMIDVARTNRLIAKLQIDAEKVLEKLKAIIGETIKPGTVKWKDYIFNKLKIPVIKKSAKTGDPKYDKETKRFLLENCKPEHKPLIDLSMQYSAWTHGVSTLNGYLRRRDSNDILHPIINTCEAITWRESCEDPNLHNVEKTGVLLNPYPVPARTCFRPRPGYVHFHLDYSGQEARLLIHYSGDYILLKICNEGNGDTHTFVAGLFYGKRFTEEIDKSKRKTMRDATKNGFFCVSYGGAAPKLAATIKVSNQEGIAAIRRLREACPKLVGLMPTIISQVKRIGYIESVFGSRCYVPREQAYMGVNYLIQHTAACMLKRGQPRVHDYLEAATGGEMKLLLPIHDELIIECPRNRLQDAKEVLKHVGHLMTDFPGRFKVPMKVEIDIATYDWSKKEKFDLST